MYIMTELGRALILGGVFLIVVGGILLLAGKIPGWGPLPGDIVIQRKNFSFFFPITTCILISLLLSFVLWLFRR